MTGGFQYWLVRHGEQRERTTARRSVEAELQICASTLDTGIQAYEDGDPRPGLWRAMPTYLPLEKWTTYGGTLAGDPKVNYSVVALAYIGVIGLRAMGEDGQTPAFDVLKGVKAGLANAIAALDPDP
jgi:hypothetical protein